MQPSESSISEFNFAYKYVSVRLNVKFLRYDKRFDRVFSVNNCILCIDVAYKLMTGGNAVRKV